MLSVEIESSDQSPTPLALSIEIPLSQGIVGIMGPSGCGKTTLLRILSGLEKRFNGSIRLEDALLWDSRTQHFIKPHQRDIGLVFQDARLFPHLTVRGNLEFAYKRSEKKLFDMDTVSEWFGLTDLLDATATALSGGERQRVAVARAVLQCPRLLLLDEPFVSLDMKARATLLECLQNLHRQTQIPMLFVSHDIHDIRQLCDRLVLMEKGKIAEHGDTLTLLNRLAMPLANEQNPPQTQAIAAMFICKPLNRLADSPLTQLALDELKLTTNVSFDAARQQVKCLIKAEDVSISLSQVSECSIANCLLVKIENISPLDEHNVVIRLSMQTQILYAQITAHSMKRLALENGMQVYALFKASAVCVL